MKKQYNFSSEVLFGCQTVKSGKTLNAFHKNEEKKFVLAIVLVLQAQRREYSSNHVEQIKHTNSIFFRVFTSYIFRILKRSRR